MNKEEAKKSIRAIIETAESLREELIMLDIQAYDEYMAVEPYEGMDELTPAQDELQEWFYELKNKTNEAIRALDDLEDMTK